MGHYLSEMMDDLDYSYCEPISRLPEEEIKFNPSDPKSVDELLGKFGPEGLYEIADVLKKAAD